MNDAAVNLGRFKSKRATRTKAETANRVWSPGAGKWIEVEEVPTAEPARARRKGVHGQWVRFPLSWHAALRNTRRISAVRLAIDILFAEFRRQHKGGEIVLSAAMTEMPNATRADATRELVRLGLIKVDQRGRQAPRVVQVNVD